MTCSCLHGCPHTSKVQRAIKQCKEQAAAAAEERAAAAATVEALRQQVIDARAEGQEQIKLLRQQLQAAGVAAVSNSLLGSVSCRGAAASRTVITNASAGTLPPTHASSLKEAAAADEEQQHHHQVNLRERYESLLSTARQEAGTARGQATAARDEQADLLRTVDALRDELRRERLAHPRGPAAWLLPPSAGRWPSRGVDAAPLRRPHSANTPQSANRPVTRSSPSCVTAAVVGRATECPPAAALQVRACDNPCCRSSSSDRHTPVLQKVGVLEAVGEDAGVESVASHLHLESQLER